MILNLTSTPLYLIEILHQTTTPGSSVAELRRCILSKFYIKPQLRNVSLNQDFRCILSKFYIKPQLGFQLPKASRSCILSKFYIKPQLCQIPRDICAVVSYRNSTSNHNDGNRRLFTGSVVSYRNSTSNHNLVGCILQSVSVVSYRNSTSNHNVGPHID